LDRRLLVLGYCLFLGPFGGVNIIIPMQRVLQAELGTNLEMVTLSISMAMFPFALLQFFSGALADKWGPRRTLMAGLAVYGISAAVCGLSPNIWTFLAGRAMQGVGLAFFNPVALAMVGGLVPAERRGYVMGWMGTINTAGIASGPLAGGLAAELDWRIAYYLIIGMTIAACLVFWATFSARSFPPAAKGSVFGRLAEAASVRSMQLVCLGGFSAFFAYGAALTFIGNALEEPPFALSEATIGTAIAMGGGAGILVSPVAGWVADRHGRGKVSVIGFFVAFLSYAGFIFATSLPVVLALFFLMGAAMAFTWAGLITLSVEVVPGARNASSTLFNAFRFTGYALSPFMLVGVYRIYGLASVLVISAAMAMVGIFTALLLFRLSRKSVQK
jgi:MFS family permease